MTDLVHVALSNAAAATALALLAAAAARWTGRPAVAHGLWLVVVLRLLMPPVVELAVPRPGVPDLVPARGAPPPPARLATPVAAADLAAPAGVPEATAFRVAGGAPKRPWLLGLWAGGALLAAGLAALRVGRFRRLARSARPAGAALAARGAELAAAVGLGRCPELRVVAAAVPPLVWSLAGAPKILLSRPLLDRLEPAERDAILVHELAHVRRRDHWVRLPELLACLLFWWHPVAWWARRSLRRWEEECCDEWVLRLDPGAGRAYAEALLKTLELTAARRPALPAFASGVEPLHRIERRLTMILRQRTVAPRDVAPRRLRRRHLTLGAVAILALGLFPTWAQPPRTVDEEAAIAAAAERRAAAMEELERRALALEEKRAALEVEQLRAREEMERELLALQAEEMRRQVEQLTAEGEDRRAEELRRHLAEVEERASLERERRELEIAHREAVRSLESQARRLELETRALESRARLELGESAAAFEDRRLELEARARELERERIRTLVATEVAALRTELTLRIRSLREMLRQTGEEEGALADRLGRLEAELETLGD